MTKAQRVRFKNRQMEYDAWSEMYAIVKYAENFGRPTCRGAGWYTGLCHLLHDIHFGPYDLHNFEGISPHVYWKMRDRIRDRLGRKSWLATPGARRPRLKWIEEIMSQVEAEAHAP